MTAGPKPAPTDVDLFDPTHPLAIADQGCFYIPGRYTASHTMREQIFVQFQVPARLSQPCPIVMIHGGGQTGVGFHSTPDGRRGWADYFVANGSAVYVVDQPGHGRSGSHYPYGPASPRDAQWVAAQHTAPERRPLWPQADLHTQWPGAGVPGDPAFDQFYASQVAITTEATAIEAAMREAGAALLDRIGPSVLLGHSQGGRLAWTIGDARPELTRAIVAVEPNGPPVCDVRSTGAPDWFEDDGIKRPWGITCGPLTYSPPARDPSELGFARQPEPDAPGLVRCWSQAGPPRKLSELAKIPILIVTAEASYHAPYDHCTSAFLRQAGVEHDFVRLADVGIRGNGHLMMLENNNLEIASYLYRWIETHARASVG